MKREINKKIKSLLCPGGGGAEGVVECGGGGGSEGDEVGAGGDPRARQHRRLRQRVRVRACGRVRNVPGLGVSLHLRHVPGRREHLVRGRERDYRCGLVTYFTCRWMKVKVVVIFPA